MQMDPYTFMLDQLLRTALGTGLQAVIAGAVLAAYALAVGFILVRAGRK